MRKKPVFIIPGFRHRSSQKSYKTIAKMLKNEGYTPIIVPISWNKKTISDTTEYFLEVLKRVRTKEKYIFGFSFGALIAFLAATKVKVDGLILCSLSPYFREDLSFINDVWDSPIMTQRYHDFATLRHTELSKKVKAKKIFLLYGEKEEKLLIKRVKKTYVRLPSKQKYLLPVENTEHAISNSRYLQAIQYTARVLH